MNNSGGEGENIKRTFNIFITVSMLVLLVGVQQTRPRLDKDGRGAEDGTTLASDAQSTTSAEPFGGPCGAVATAGDNFTPGPQSYIIPDVPAFTWFNGCGPTSAAMVVAYWNELLRKQGFTWVMPGDSTTQTQMVNDVIASPEHIQDYARPYDNETTGLILDKSEPGNTPHFANSLADWMQTSFSARDNMWGWSWFSDMPKAFLGYLGSVNPGKWTVVSYNLRLNDYSLDFSIFQSFVSRDFPVILLVDSNADGLTDHFIPAFGWDVEHAADGTEIDYYAAYNTWDYQVHWYRWQPMIPNKPYGVYGATVLFIEHQPPIVPTNTPTLSPTPSFTPLVSLTPTQTYTPFYTDTKTLAPSSTWTQTQIPTIRPTITPTATPAAIPHKSNSTGLVVAEICLVLVAMGLTGYEFWKNRLKKGSK